MAKNIFIVFILLLVFTPSAESRVYLDINAPAFVQMPIVLPLWRSVGPTPSHITEKIYEILVRNLTLSGFFKVLDHSVLPTHLKKKEGIPSGDSLHEWLPSGGELLLGGEVTLSTDGLYLRLKFHLIDLIEKRVLIEKRYDNPFQHHRTVVHQVVDEVIQILTGERGVHTTKIAYVVKHGVTREILIADFDGANVTPITRNHSINISPVWTPDGRRIAFTSYLKRNPDLYLIDIDGTNLQRFSFHPGLNVSPSWSPDGKRIVLMMGKEGKSDIYLLEADGTLPKRLTSGHGNESTPRWSPDGQQIVFSSDRSGTPQIYIMSSDGSRVRRLTFEGNYNVSPSWSPKGDRIAFCGRIGGQFHIFTIGVDGTGLKKLTPDGSNNESPYWSPDGRYIAFSSTRLGGSKIFIMNANGVNQRPLTALKGWESTPSWSNRFE